VRLHRFSNTLTVMVVAFLGVVACSGAPGSSSNAHPPVEGTPLSQTIVRLQKDGKPVITRLPIAQGGGSTHGTAGLMALDCPPGACNEVVDPGCAEADLWLFDQPNFRGNELCVISATAPNYSGFLDLADVDIPQDCVTFCLPGRSCTRLCPTWSGRIQSWSAGPGGQNLYPPNVVGYFYEVPWWESPPGIQQFFAPWAYESTASPIVKAAVTLQY
jgi:hypothetical protein